MIIEFIPNYKMKYRCECGALFSSEKNFIDHEQSMMHLSYLSMADHKFSDCEICYNKKSITKFSICGICRQKVCNSCIDNLRNIKCPFCRTKWELVTRINIAI